MPSISTQTSASLDRIDDILQMERVQSKRLSENEIDRMSKAYNEMSDASSAKEWGYVMKFAAAFFQIAAAGYGPNDFYGKIFSGIHSVLDNSGNFKVQWEESKTSKLQGLLELVRTELQRTQGDESELVQKLNKIEEMLMAAIRALEEQQATPFKKG